MRHPLRRARSSNAFGVRGWTARTSGSRVTEPTAFASAGVAACSVSRFALICASDPNSNRGHLGRDRASSAKTAENPGQRGRLVPVVGHAPQRDVEAFQRSALRAKRPERPLAERRPIVKVQHRQNDRGAGEGLAQYQYEDRIQAVGRRAAVSERLATSSSILGKVPEMTQRCAGRLGSTRVPGLPEPGCSR